MLYRRKVSNMRHNHVKDLQVALTEGSKRENEVAKSSPFF